MLLLPSSCWPSLFSHFWPTLLHPEDFSSSSRLWQTRLLCPAVFIQWPFSASFPNPRIKLQSLLLYSPSSKFFHATFNYQTHSIFTYNPSPKYELQRVEIFVCFIPAISLEPRIIFRILQTFKNICEIHEWIRGIKWSKWTLKGCTKVQFLKVPWED